MDLLHRDLRCIDAHGHLGNLEFERSPERAIRHFEMGLKIGELSLPPGFDGFLVWGRLYNRPYLRCLHSYGLCLWRLGRLEEARVVFERNLALNPNDNQGVRFCLHDVLKGLPWNPDRDEERDAQAGEIGEDEWDGSASDVWTRQAEAALKIRNEFGLTDALNYIVGEKLFTFLDVADSDEEFTDELPVFVEWIKENFTREELEPYLGSIRAKGSRRHHDIPDQITRDRKRLEHVRFLLLDSGKTN